MNFETYINAWTKNEVTQGRIMIGLGVLVVLSIYFIVKSNNEFFKGAIIPFAILAFIGIFYGGYIVYSRPAHAQESIIRYAQSPEKGIEEEEAKHIMDNQLGNTLLKVYPILVILSAIGLMLASTPHYKGMAVGFVLLFISTYIIDYGFISRSDKFIEFLHTL